MLKKYLTGSNKSPGTFPSVDGVYLIPYKTLDWKKRHPGAHVPEGKTRWKRFSSPTNRVSSSHTDGLVIFIAVPIYGAGYHYP